LKSGKIKRRGRRRPKKNFTPEEIISTLREAKVLLSQGQPIGGLSRLVIRQQTYCRRRKEYGGLPTEQARPLKDLEREYARLKKLVADLSLDKAMLQEARPGKSQARPSSA
jgi:putative transposase